MNYKVKKLAKKSEKVSLRTSMKSKKTRLSKLKAATNNYSMIFIQDDILSLLLRMLYGPNMKSIEHWPLMEALV